MKKWFGVLLAVALCAALLCIGAAAASSGDAIEIGTAEELEKIGVDEKYPLDGNYILTADINLGTGMVIIGLASLIIGETLMPRGKTWMKALGAILGSILYRFIIAIALRLDLPSECLKLISAVIVALAIGLPAIKSAVRPATKGGKA